VRIWRKRINSKSWKDLWFFLFKMNDAIKSFFFLCHDFGRVLHYIVENPSKKCLGTAGLVLFSKWNRTGSGLWTRTLHFVWVHIFRIHSSVLPCLRAHSVSEFQSRKSTHGAIIIPVNAIRWKILFWIWKCKRKQ